MNTKPIDTIIAGAGGGRGSWFVSEIAKHHDYRVTALVDTEESAADVARKACGLDAVPIFGDMRAALDAVACDATVIVTPDGQHVEPATTTLASGKHVFVEKPLAVTLADCLAIVRADRKAGGKTMVGFNLRFAPFYRLLHARIRQGDLGDVLTIQADEFYDGGRTYFRRWNRFREAGGGLWITKASHDFDLLYWLSGSLPVRVKASAALSYYKPREGAGTQCRCCPIEKDCADSALRTYEVQGHTMQGILDARDRAGKPWDLCLFNSEKDTFDHGIAIVEMDNGCIATYTVNVVSPPMSRTMRVSGTRGAIEGGLDQAKALWRKRDAGGAVEELDAGGAQGGHGGGDANLLNAFASFVRGEPAPVTRPAEAAVAVAMGEAATLASDSGRTIAMTSVRGWKQLLTFL